jgi:V8-like Glu-specific endopeptidase
MSLIVGVSSLALLLGALPTLGRGPSAETVERVAAARAAYGLPAGPSHVRMLVSAMDDEASERYGFPLTRAEHTELTARSTYAQAFASETLPFVERLEGYGGAWVDHAAGGTIVVGLTKVRPKAKRQVRARLPKADRGVRFAQVDHSAAALGRALRRADRDWSALGTGLRPQAFGISYRDNRLVVKVLPGQLATARRFAARMARRARVDVAIEPSARVTDSACRSRQKCFGPLRLGARINYPKVYRSRAPLSQWNCAIGFMLSDRTILTAGHCTHRRAGPWHGHAAYRTRYGPIGNLKSTRYTSERRDLARIKLDDWGANKTTRIFGDTWPTILTQPGEVVEGMDVCVSLARQDRFWCGRVTEPVARWWSSTAGIWVQGAGMRFDAPGRTALPGDSGSPVVARSRPCPGCTPRRTPIGIVNAGNEADGRARDPQSGRPIDTDLYFAEVAWALEDPRGWPWLDIYTGPKSEPTPRPTPESTPTPQPTATPEPTALPTEVAPSEAPA